MRGHARCDRWSHRGRSEGRPKPAWLLAVSLLAVSLTWGIAFLGQVEAEDRIAAAGANRSVVVEAYVRASDAAKEATITALKAFCDQRPGLVLVVREVDHQPTNEQRLEQIARYYQVSASDTPLIYVCNRALTRLPDRTVLVEELRRALRVEVFVRSGCSRCASAKAYLPTFQARYPALEIVFRDITQDTEASGALQALVAAHRTSAASVPVFHLCRRLVVGFFGPEASGARLDEVLSRWTVPDARPGTGPAASSAASPAAFLHGKGTNWPAAAAELLVGLARGGDVPFGAAGTVLLLAGPAPSPPGAPAAPAAAESGAPPSVDLALPLPGGSDRLADDSLPLPTPGACPADERQDSVQVPLLGKLQLRQMGLPAFTVAIGLVDGFNPCAMWVLVFLLSVLVNLHDRRKMFLVAGTFVVISGAAYYAFMAAWLNVFLLVGYLRPIQVLLGALALVVGAVHIKDFFAFHQGITFSIPESAKPGIYARVRAIVTAEHLGAALAGACVLAVLVNIVELLCTAGLPALYTEVLTMQRLPPWQYYGYLGLYNLAYMFDDLCLVSTMIVTLSRARLQETHGRWLKLLSGLVILALGGVMILAPDWLV